MRIDALSSRPHYRAHLLPLWEALPDELRGSRIDLDATSPQFAALRHVAVPSSGAVLVASFRDMDAAARSGYRRIALVEHGIGQPYLGLGSGCYPGGPARHPVSLFLSPNETAAERDRKTYPRARVEVIGDPRLDDLPARVPGPPKVAISFHWEWRSRIPETRSALPHYQAALWNLARAFPLIGHCHPRAAEKLVPLYRRMGVEYVPSFDDVLRQAFVYVCDNSSSMFEAAAAGLRVVTLNAPWYRRDVEHGLRFWAAANIGRQVDEPGELLDAVDGQWRGFPWPNEHEIALAYGPEPFGASRRGAVFLAEWLS